MTEKRFDTGEGIKVPIEDDEDEAVDADTFIAKRYPDEE